MKTIEFIVYKSQVEKSTGMSFTDEQWSAIKEEMEDCLDYYFYDELPRIVNDLENDKL